MNTAEEIVYWMAELRLRDKEAQEARKEAANKR